MASSQDKVFGTTELLETILLYIKPTEALANTQRVSKRWKETISSSPTFQQRCFFFKASTKQLAAGRGTNDERYTKNHILARIHPNLFQVQVVDNQIVDSTDRLAVHFGPRLPYHSPPEVLQPRWPAQIGSWRRMLLANPPITKLRWEIRRMGEDSCSLLPGLVAEFNFPDGLRMGDLFDFIITTCGDHLIIWPRRMNGEVRDYYHAPSPFRDWHNDNIKTADKDCVLFVKQRIVPLTPGYHRTPYMMKYQSNLSKLERLERQEDNEERPACFSLCAPQPLDSNQTMEMFLNAAQTPI
ncbi:hypothetical protein F4819DRAFT_504881 [Hypoxylon fuscum]|nr:hypothetical protein F4819DRAFT_504881 [Hypoxylon fuscum]